MELKRSLVAGIMNKDLDERLIPDGQYRDAMNVTVGTSEGSDVGALSNELGNTKSGDLRAAARVFSGNPTLELTGAKTIGAISVPAEFLIFWFVKYNSGNIIASYNELTGLTSILVMDTRAGAANVLNFNTQYLITGVNYISDLLFWTDGLNPPRRVDTKTNYGFNTFTEEEINVIVKPPLAAPTLALRKEDSQTNNITDKFLYFSYRYKYQNNEYSSLAPFSEVAFFPKDFQYDYGTGSNKSMVNFNNTVDISFDIGSDIVKEIQLVFKDSAGLNVNVIDNFSRQDIKDGKISAVSFSSPIATLNGFSNNKIYGVLPANQLTRLFDNVPLKAKAQELIGSRLIYGNYTQFYNIVDIAKRGIQMDYSIRVTPEDRLSTDFVVGEPVKTMRSDRDYEVGICYVDAYGRMSTVLTTVENSVYIGPENSDTGNKLVLTINNEAPDFATKYRVMIKQNKGSYYNIFPTVFYAEGPFVYMKINESDVDKVKANDYIVIKASPTGITNSAEQYKVLEVETKPTNFLNNTARPNLAGVYLKIKIENNISFNDDNLFTYQSVGKGRTGVGGRRDSVCNKTTENPLPERSALIEAPIFYGVGLNDLATSFSWISMNNTKDIRYTVTIDGVNTFKYTMFGMSKVLGAKIPITGGAQVLQDENGRDIANIKFAAINGHTIGDSWRISCRSLNGQNYFGDRTAWGGGNDAQGSCAIIPGERPSTGPKMEEDLPIKAGAIITIKIDETKVIGGSDQPLQTFISSNNYANIEEWFIEDGAYTKFAMFSDGNKGYKSIFFRRSYDFKYTDNINQTKQSQRGAVRMYILGYGNTPGTLTDCERSLLTVDFSITQVDKPTILETVPDVNDADIYHEVATFGVSNGLHAGSAIDGSLNQTRAAAGTSKKSAVVSLDNVYNAFCFRNGVESDRIRDDFNAPLMKYSPRTLSTIENYEQEQVTNGLTYSGVFREDTGTNRLNEFNLSTANFKYVDRFFGSIQKLYSRDTDLVVFQENKVSVVLYGKNLLSDSTGGGSVTSVPEILGTQIAFPGEYGISYNPESFAVWGSDMFFTDARRGVALRVAGNAIQEISMQGMRDWFKDLFIAGINRQKIGVFDPYNQMYVLASNDDTASACELVVTPSTLTVDKTSQSKNIFDIQSNSGWVITNIPVWMTVAPSSGTGNQDVSADIAANNTGVSRTATLTITASCGVVRTFTITQTATVLKRRSTFVIGEPSESGKVSTQKYNYTSSGTAGYEFNDVVFKPTDVTLYDTASDVAGINGIPAPGDTVTVYAYKDATSSLDAELNPFIPTAGNKVYYLVSNTEYTAEDYATVLGLATPITMSLAGVEYSGTFVYSAPSNEQYLYLIWDYRNTVSCGSSVSYSGVAATTPTIVNMGANNGRVSYTYDAQSTPDRFTISVGGNIVADSGYVGLNSLANYNALIAAGVPASEINLSSPYNGLVNNSTGTLSYVKNSTAETVLTVYSPLSSNSWTATTACASLTSFTLDTTNGTIANVCSQTPSTTKYHNADGGSVSIGCTIYNESTGATVYDGGNAYHKTGTNLMFVTSSGVVTEIATCVCSETAPPIVTASNMEFLVGQVVNIKVPATNSPTSYTLVSACSNFSLFGGSDGAVFYGANCETGYYETIVVSGGETASRCFASGTVSQISGSANATLVVAGACSGFSLPAGLSFEATTGVISGTVEGIGEYQASFTATNCFGTGPATQVVISSVLNDTPATSFEVFINGQATSASACALLVLGWDYLYHNGYYTYPIVGDTVYLQARGGNMFDGNNLWYKINNNQSCQISDDGVVLAVFNCGSTPPTPPTPPAGGYYQATLCNSTYSAVLYDAVTRVVANGTIFKTTDGNCWTKTADLLPQTATFTVPTTLVTSASCAICTGEAPGLTEVFLTDAGTKSVVCASTAYYSYWTNGTVGSSGTLYLNSSGTTIAPAGFYKNQAAPTNAHQWSGTAWILTQAC
jgi:hypothetical protein